MNPRRHRRNNRLRRLLAALFASAAVACGVLSPEEQLLTDFFEASRVYDTSVMARLSALPLNPQTDGIVDAFDVQRVDRLDGESVRVTVIARVRHFDGQVDSRQFVFAMARRDGQLFISGWQ